MTRQNLQGRRIALFSGNYNYTRDGACQVLNRWVAHLEAAYGCDVRVYSPTSGSPAFAPAGTLVTVPSLGAFPRLSRGWNRNAGFTTVLILIKNPSPQPCTCDVAFSVRGATP